MYHVCVPGVPGGQKKVLRPLDLELQTVVRCCVGAENGEWSSGRAATAATETPPERPTIVFILSVCLSIFCFSFQSNTLLHISQASSNRISCYFCFPDSFKRHN